MPIYDDFLRSILPSFSQIIYGKLEVFASPFFLAVRGEIQSNKQTLTPKMELILCPNTRTSQVFQNTKQHNFPSLPKY
jgi:hypothetical protein